MSDPNFVILYVDSPAASANFYQKLLGNKPVEASSTFALFALKSGLMLGLWSKHTVEPAATAAGGGAELAFALDNRHELDELYAKWKSQKLPIIQEPTDMDFGHTFVALDPDGHRLRVFVPVAP